MVRRAHLEPLSLYQSLEASDGPAGRIKDDLSQGGHLQGGVRPLCTVNQHWRSLPDTHTRLQFVTCYSMCLIHYYSNRQTLFPDLSMHWAARQAVVRISLTWVCQLEASNLLNQRSILCDWSLHASTSFIRLSWSTLDLETTDLSQRWRECLNSSFILNHIASKVS